MIRPQQIGLADPPVMLYDPMDFTPIRMAYSRAFVSLRHPHDISDDITVRKILRRYVLAPMFAVTRYATPLQRLFHRSMPS